MKMKHEHKDEKIHREVKSRTASPPPADMRVHLCPGGSPWPLGVPLEAAKRTHGPRISTSPAVVSKEITGRLEKNIQELTLL